jgi:molybdenum cofactor cytidylyltransferase
VSEEFTSNLAVALLAAGRSTRFGAADKLSADLGGRPLIAWAAAAGLRVDAAHHFMVAPADAAFIATAPGYQLLINPSPERGMASSLRIAAKAAQDAGAAALLILLADVPFVQTDHLRRLTSAGARPSQAIFTRSPSGIAQPPALFPAAMFPHLLALEGDHGARALAHDALHIDADADQLLDIDREQDLAEARRRLA